jgi:cytochrome c556
MLLKKSIALAVAASAGLLLALPASAQQFAKTEDAVKYRQGAFDVLAAHFGRMGAMANDKAPYDAKAAQESAEVVAFMSKLPWAGFAAGAEGGNAKPEIWKDRAKFDDLAKKMQEEVAKLNDAAKTGKLDDLKTAFGAAGKSCKACHDDFKKK